MKREESKKLLPILIEMERLRGERDHLQRQLVEARAEIQGIAKLAAEGVRYHSEPFDPTPCRDRYEAILALAAPVGEL